MRDPCGRTESKGSNVTQDGGSQGPNDVQKCTSHIPCESTLTILTTRRMDVYEHE